VNHNNTNTLQANGSPASLTVGDIVLVAFPFSDGSASKLRPALVLASLDAYGDALLMGITSKPDAKHTMALNNADLSTGQLPKTSWLKSASVTAVHQSRISKVLATVRPTVLVAVRQQICPRLGCQ
jgi:mRNA interferase MazF